MLLIHTAILRLQKIKIRIQMTTFGDNDDGDCFNNGFYTSAQVYIAPPVEHITSDVPLKKFDRRSGTRSSLLA